MNGLKQIYDKPNTCPLAHSSKGDTCEKKLKVFVWEEFCPNSGDGLAIAIAYNEREARAAIVEILGAEPHIWGPVNVFDASSKIPAAFCIPGGSWHKDPRY